MSDDNPLPNGTHQEIPVTPAPGSRDSSDNKNPKRRFTKQQLGIGVVILVLIVIGVFFATKSNNNDPQMTDNVNSAQYETADISIDKTGISPSVLKIKSGTVVTWTNNDIASHQIVADEFPEENASPDFDSEVLNQNDTISYTFTKTGTFNFHDEANPEFKHTVIVE